MVIAITGASGLIGTALQEHFRETGIPFRPLVRRPPQNADEIQWNPTDGYIDREALSRTSAVVHLAGENIGDGRWTRAKKQRIYESRVQTTRLIAEALAQDGGPRVFVSVSGINFYGNRDGAEVDESSPAGDTFLAEVCKAWEAAAEPARKAGLRVVHPRLGVALSRRGGALEAIAKPIRLGIGGRLGSGSQSFSWISLVDLVRAIEFILENDSLVGPINIVAPTTVTNGELTKTVGRLLSRPTAIPAPAAALKLALGRERAEELLLQGNRVIPRRLHETGFEWKHPNLEDALRWALEIGSPAEESVGLSQSGHANADPVKSRRSTSEE